MHARKENEKSHKRNPYIRENPNFQSDERVNIIYERYHAGKTIIMDDLKYLLLKNPEAFEKIVRSIIRPKSEKGFNFGSIGIEKGTYMKKSENTEKIQQNYIDYTSGGSTQIETIANISDIMSTVKSIFDNMSKKELLDISQNIYDSQELMKRISVLNDWNDILPYEKVMNTYVQDKEFDISV
jgi:hypothetical protein